MCSEFHVTYRIEDLEKSVAQAVMNLTGAGCWNVRVRLTAKAPVLQRKNGKLLLQEATFPSRPFPNARLSGLAEKKQNSAAGRPIIRVYEKKSWREGFIGQRCVVPMSYFIEPAYWGPEEGSAVAFLPPQKKLLFAAAIRIPAYSPKTKDAFSILTHLASDQVLNYHQRLIVLLKAKDAVEWLSGDKADPVEKYDFLLRHRYVPEFRVKVDRKMASGWMTRREHHLRDREIEMAYRERLNGERLNSDYLAA